MPLFDAIHANLHLCLLSEFETSLVQFTQKINFPSVSWGKVIWILRVRQGSYTSNSSEQTFISCSSPAFASFLCIPYRKPQKNYLYLCFLLPFTLKPTPLQVCQGPSTFLAYSSKQNRQKFLSLQNVHFNVGRDDKIRIKSYRLCHFYLSLFPSLVCQIPSFLRDSILAYSKIYSCCHPLAPESSISLSQSFS